VWAGQWNRPNQILMLREYEPCILRLWRARHRSSSLREVFDELNRADTLVPASGPAGVPANSLFYRLLHYFVFEVSPERWRSPTGDRHGVVEFVLCFT
jgi:hypothetical protein